MEKYFLSLVPIRIFTIELGIDVWLMGKLVASNSFCFSSWAYRSKGKEEKETTKLSERDLEKSRKGRDLCLFPGRCEKKETGGEAPHSRHTQSSKMLYREGRTVWPDHPLKIPRGSGLPVWTTRAHWKDSEQTCSWEGELSVTWVSVVSSCCVAYRRQKLWLPQWIQWWQRLIAYKQVEGKSYIDRSQEPRKCIAEPECPST